LAQGNNKTFSLAFAIGAGLQSSFKTAFKGVDRQLAATNRSVQNAGKAWADFGRRAGTLALGVAGVAAGVGAAAWRMASDIAAAGDRVAGNAARIRMSNQSYQELEFAFRQAGFGADEFSRMMEGLDSTLRNAAASDRGMQRFAEEFGLSAANLNKMDPAKRIQRLTDYLNYLEDPLKRDSLSMELFGRSWTDMAGVLGQGSAGLREAAEMAQRTGNILSDEAIANSEAYEQMRRNLRATIDGIKNSLFKNLIPFFTQALGLITERLDSVDWASWGEKIVGWVQAAIPKVIAIGQAIGDFIGRIRDGIAFVVDFVGGWRNLAIIIGSLIALKTAIAGVTAVIKTIIAVTKIWKAVQMIMNVVLSANPIGLIILAVMALIGIIILLVRNWDKVADFFKGLWDRIKNIFRAVFEFIRGLVMFYVNVWLTIFRTIGNFFINLWERVEGIFTGVFNFIRGLIMTYVNIWLAIFRGIRDFFVWLWETVKGGVLAFHNAVVGFVTGLVDRIRDIIGRITGFFTNIWEKVTDGVRKFIDRVIEFFQPLLNVIQGVGGFIGRIFGRNKAEVEIAYTGAVPAYAQGGIINRPHVGMVGEAGPEAIIPLRNDGNSRGLWETAGRLAGFNRPEQGGASGISIPISVSVSVASGSDAAAGVRAAATDIAEQVKKIVRNEVPNILSDISRSKARTAY
jgi:hypothetical protein